MDLIELPSMLVDHVARIEKAMASEGVKDRYPLDTIGRLLEALEGAAEDQARQEVLACREELRSYVETQAPPWRCEFVEAIQSVVRVMG